ncbi:MAG: adenosylhomocysteinase [Petroclostridium sp.]|jgi:adenosylhomocysteinase|uniref:adenosylhomocysteinase n=1 Tax=Petroclostridium xylanilyticum TaxID=1792311 RepID=UPI000B98FE27|nr:adenosylhomocysteinase [Petroclostridium xylanilyticum]MBZ4646000.1 adenosylhomocysteinase [Clostridia bacterium]MDK2810135.1 adenosylhomocysteinase [Petroclostridium sp.]
MRESVIRDIHLANSGRQKIEWVKKNMPLLRYLEEDFKKNQYFKGLRAVVCVHLEAKTAYLAKVLAAGGAEVSVTGSNPLSTQDDVAAALVADGLKVYAWYGATEKEYFEHLNYALDIRPNIVIDDGGDLVHLLHGERQELLPDVFGGCEETTTGVIRLKARAKEGLLKFPMISVNDAYCKYLFDNRYGTGQSVWDGVMRTTNLIVSGKNVVIIGYGWCGKGCAMRAKGLGANVIVCEVDPIKAIEAVMDGFSVMPMNEAAKIGDFFITVTGCNRVIYDEHYKVMKNGAILANAGHFDVEICIPELEAMAVEKKEMRKNIMGYKMADGRWIHLLAEGRLVNLAAGDGHPAEIMDMSFALQALSAKHIAQNHKNMENKVYEVPDEIDQYVAQLKLQSMGISIDTLTEAQRKYLSSWGE